MTLAASCGARTVELAGERFDLIPFGADGWARGTERCHDCGVRPGGFHHQGCDVERCPRCAGQLFCCDCWEDDLVGVEGLEPPTSAL